MSEKRSCENCGNAACKNSVLAFLYDECVKSKYAKFWKPEAPAQEKQGAFNMELKKITCEVCGEEFHPDKKNTYTAEEPRTDAGFIFLPRKYFSATDCPRCGCQIRLAPRAPRVTLPEYKPEPEDQEESGAEE